MLKFALAGNPNSGKTTLFNSLTGSTAHVGNWPGVTVDKRDGVYKKCEEPISIVDLPGIYSLSPYTPEEVIARNYILDERPDCVINIVDATNMERNLYLSTQIMEIDVPMVIALNMMDAVEKAEERLPCAVLENMESTWAFYYSRDLDWFWEPSGTWIFSWFSNEGKLACMAYVSDRQAKATVVFDASLRGACNLVAGGNETDVHYKGLNIERDTR